MKLIDDGNSTFGYKIHIFYHVCISCSVMSKLCDPMDFHKPGSSVLEFSRQECRSKLLFPSPGELPILGIESRSPALQADSLPPKPPGKPDLEMGPGLFSHDSCLTEILCKLSRTLWNPPGHKSLFGSPISVFSF